MKTKNIFFLVISAVLIIALTGCNFSTAQPPEDVPPDAIYTAAAQTVIAKFTQDADLPTVEIPQESPSETPEIQSPDASVTPEATATNTPTPTETSTPTEILEAILEEAGEVVAAIEAGHIQSTNLTELGEVVAGKSAGRESAEEITFFKSVGVAVQDAMTARVALENALNLGLGQEVSW